MRSDAIKAGVERAPHRSLLKAVGVTDADMQKPFVAQPRRGVGGATEAPPSSNQRSFA